MLLAIALAGCEGGSAPDTSYLSGRLTILNDDARLAERLHRRDVPVELVPSIPSLVPRGLELVLVAEIDPPEIDGRVLQATSVARHGNLAIVGYNMAGADYLGAIEVIKLAGFPRITALALFDDTDVSAVAVDEGNVYAAEATGSGAFPDPAVLEILELEGDDLELEDSERIGLPSFTGTSVHPVGTRIFATSGDGGGLTVLDVNTWEEIASVELDDARWVTSDEDHVIVGQGTPGRISVFDAVSLDPLGTFEFPGLDVPEAKSTLVLAGGKAIVAAGAEGAHLLDPMWDVMLTVPVPDTPGLPPDVAVTNAVSAQRNLLFLSNGGAGVQLVEFDDDLDSDTDDPPAVQQSSRLLLPDGQSVNHASYRDGVLVVAAGLGGVKIVEVR